MRAPGSHVRHGLLWILFLLFASTHVQASACIRLQFHKLKKGGILHAGLYRKTDVFLKEGGEFQAATLEAQAGDSPVFCFTNLPVGFYAAAFYLDVNRNGRADRGFLGLPLEPFGFHQNLLLLLGVPRFEDCAFQVGPGTNEFRAVLRE